MGDPPPGRGAEGRGAGDGYTTRRGGAPGRGGGRPAGRAAGSRGPPPAPGEGSPASGPALGPARPAPAPRRAIGPRPLVRRPAAHRPSSAPPLPADRGGPPARGTLGLVVRAACHLPTASGGGTTTSRSPRGRARPHPFPLLCKAPLPVFSAPSPPHPPWSSILANSNVCTQHRIGPRGARAPPAPSCKLSTRRAPLSPHAGFPHPQCGPASPPPLPARLGSPKSHAPGWGGLGHKPVHFAPNPPSRAAPPPRARDPGRLQPPGSCQPPPPLKLAERPRFS